MEWAIEEVARVAGTTSRTLRHYDDVGLLAPSRVGANGHRYYDERALVRLQRILLLRELGVGIPVIAEILRGRTDDRAALATHLRALEQEKKRLDRQIASVEGTITRMERGEQLVAEQMFDGFDHTGYREEVTERWGAEAYSAGDAWWRQKTAEERAEFRAQHDGIAADYAAARQRGDAPQSDVVQAVVARHVAWLNLSAFVTGGEVTAERLRGYGDMYVADPRFAKNYGGLQGAEFVRDAFQHYAATRLASAQ